VIRLTSHHVAVKLDSRTRIDIQDLCPGVKERKRDLGDAYRIIDSWPSLVMGEMVKSLRYGINI